MSGAQPQDIEEMEPTGPGLEIIEARHSRPAVAGAVPVGTDPSDIALADLDGDGDLEAIICHTGSEDVQVLQWDGMGYVLAFTFPTGVAPSGV